MRVYTTSFGIIGLPDGFTFKPTHVSVNVMQSCQKLADVESAEVYSWLKVTRLVSEENVESVLADMYLSFRLNQNQEEAKTKICQA